jgi:Na+/H+ antiporter NhaD/arsenite permease-like protein
MRFETSRTSLFAVFIFLILLLMPEFVSAAGDVPSIGRIRVEFILFALVLVGVAVFHNKTFYVAATGLCAILAFKLIFDPHFKLVHHFLGETPLLEQVLHKHLREGEWSTLVNLLGLLFGFGLLSRHFEESHVPKFIPKFLPEGFWGPFVLLWFVGILSSFLDNIAAALIGGTIALVIFDHRVHMGYIAAIVAASNAGGSGSVVGDTTTTMMWIDGVSALNVLHAFIAAGVALFTVAWFAAHQQHKHQPIVKTSLEGVKVDWMRLGIVILILIGAIISNILYDMPALGVWIALLIGAFIRPTDWHDLRNSALGTMFLLCLVTCASLMPVEELPAASWQTAFSLGFISAVFDNIPLTKLCLEQGCFDWGMLAYTVGFGGSMIWFGSSAGVAICNKFPEGRDVGLWLRKGFHVTLGYVLGFFVLLFVMGWEPADTRDKKVIDCNTCNPVQQETIVNHIER